MSVKPWNGHDWENMTIKHPKRKHLSLKELDKIPYYDENNKKIDHLTNERQEQYFANDYIEPDMVVLELGARYGTVSCVINNKLENPKNHAVFEPDSTVIPSLIKNRKSHKAQFTIFAGVISNKPVSIVHNGYGTNTTSTMSDTSNATTITIKTWTFLQILQKTKLPFDCLVADCEGCLETFFKENFEHIKSFRLIIFEKDRPDTCDYAYISKKLTNNNFICLNDKFINVWKKYN